MHHPLMTRLLLIIALLFTQTGGLVHGISHTLEEQSRDQSLPHDKLCDLCEAYAQLDSALGSHVVPFLTAEQPTSLADAPFNRVVTAGAFSAYASRAPPCSA